MKTRLLLICLIAIAVADISCRKKAPSDSGTDDAKLRPEVAAARKGASPSPAFGDGSANPTPSPTSAANPPPPR